MALVSAVLLIVFSAMCVSSYQNAREELHRSLEMALSQKRGPGSLPAKPGEDFFRQNEPLLIPAFWVLTDTEGNLLQSSPQGSSLSEELLLSAIQSALDSPGEKGFLPQWGLSFLKSGEPAGYRIAFADTSRFVSSFRNTAVTSLILIFTGFAAFFGISLFLSRWALRPVEEAWEQQRRFIADASHELKTPLTVILANTSILLSHKEKSVLDQLRWVENTREEAAHMKKLVEDLLFLARSDNNGAVLQKSYLSFSELLWSCLLQFEPVAFEAGVDIQPEIAENISMEGDMTQLKQLAAILLDNACKYAGKSGVVRVSLSRKQPQGEWALLRVHNTGPSIPPKELPHIFERFYRSDKARTREGGYGLGLPIAKTIAEAHNGSITVESGEEEGTVFIVALPCEKEESPSFA